MRVSIVAAIFCALGAVLLTGLAAGAANAVKARSGGLELSLSVGRYQYRGGETADLAFALRNISGPAVMMLSFSPALFGFAAYDSKGNQIVAPSLPQKPIMGPRRGLMAPPRGTILQPGKSITAQLTWDLTVTDSSGRQTPLAPGTYTLIGYAWWDRGGAPRLQTPPLVIRVVAGAP